MGLLDKLKFNLWDDADAIIGLISKWQPKNCKTEKDFEKSLYDYLHRELGDLQITRQYARGRIRSDLVVADKVIIELKTNLDTTSKLQRLIGQLNGYESWEGRVIVLLTGKTDPNLRKELDRFVKKYEPVFPTESMRFVVAQK
jgi:hypothetical protein